MRVHVTCVYMTHLSKQIRLPGVRQPTSIDVPNCCYTCLLLVLCLPRPYRGELLRQVPHDNIVIPLAKYRLRRNVVHVVYASTRNLAGTFSENRLLRNALIFCVLWCNYCRRMQERYLFVKQ